mmetsp:Transcript_41494/g.67344  ORF Transcript_41494/g.67344 Transcript_41494/m.67344 type:complete len:187 (+) Transcript_41494:89-649(+)|eukprot:CAMPEP_0184645792 /NCGR_PEP_ID=MMETSP0308-20130426/2385_1 /TAXON_ID=38269 /ORGANISM="Gloeochaete witrockiana, Strain SAG 46.84" /LENGTH=186 /DNA_ID=CAMNT_0027075205 /DNA_START=80 /DNA_END=640 /DNA_ORIENTATION=+
MKNIRDQLTEVQDGCSPSGGVLKAITFLTMVGGLLILGLGAAAIAKNYGSAWTPGALVAIGVLILLFSCLGFWAAIAKNRGVLCCFAVLVGIITFFEFVTAIACFALQGTLDSDLQKMYDERPEDYERAFGNCNPECLKAVFSERLKLLGGFSIVLVILQIINIVTAVLYRKALRDGEYEKWRSQL